MGLIACESSMQKQTRCLILLYQDIALLSLYVKSNPLSCLRPLESSLCPWY